MTPPLRGMPFTMNGFDAKIILDSINASRAAKQHFERSACPERSEVESKESDGTA